MTKKLVHFLSFLTVLAAALLVGFFFLSQHTLYFKYHSLEPQKEVFNVGESIIMVSFYDRKLDILPLEWYDVLFCKESGRLIGQKDTGATTGKQDNIKVVWVFKGTPENRGAPTTADSCYMESTITYKVFGIIKASQTIISPSFKIQ